MYWPIGAPTIYEQDLVDDLTTSEDGLSGTIHEETSETLDDEGEGNGQHERPSTSGGVRAKRNDARNAQVILAMSSSRTGNLLATMTEQRISIWQTKPAVILATVLRSKLSLSRYGPNVSLAMRPDAAILVVHTSLGYVITYTLSSDFDAPAYQLILVEEGQRSARRRSITNAARYGTKARDSLFNSGGSVQETRLHFRMVMKLDAGISHILALDDELVVATRTPAAVQCIRWNTNRDGPQTSEATLSEMPWLDGATALIEMVYDRPMNLFVWITAEGGAYAVQRSKSNQQNSSQPTSLFRGHGFHSPANLDEYAIKAAINSRFSLVAIGCRDGSTRLYSIRDYAGGTTLINNFAATVSSFSSGPLAILSYSPDGYCLFAGYEKGWITTTVYGQVSATSFTSEPDVSKLKGDHWLLGICDAHWIGGGCELIISTPKSNQLTVLEFARAALVGCFSPANAARGLLQTSTGLMAYTGHDTSDLTTISADVSLWHHVQIPVHYLSDQWPIRSSVISPDGRYIAIAGQRGLAHYSINSHRWKTFDDIEQQNEFAVRGGMCWYQHILVAAVETSSSYEIRLYSRETPLATDRILYTETLSFPVVHLAPSGDDSLLVYTYENILDHYLIVPSKKSVRLVKVGQIGLHGIIRSPSRVRAVSWIVPDHQMLNGDPSQDVSVASILFLVDGKLVLLQPTTNDQGELKYDMRVVAQSVEYYLLARDIISNTPSPRIGQIENGTAEELSHDEMNDPLHDSLWLFDGQMVKVWADVQSLLESAPTEYGRELPTPIDISIDFYPLSVLLPKGLLFGLEADLAQPRDGYFAFFRMVDRTTLFVPDVLRHQLSRFDSPAALHLSHKFKPLPYFAHALEILLHKVLDDEVESPSTSDTTLLPAVLSFLSSFPEYLDVVVQCTRKTELRSWRTLFAHLPPPQSLFEQSLEAGALKTASGYLLVLHTLAEIHSTSPQVIRLLRAAKDARDWDLAKELARFLMALDESGETLEQALTLVDVVSPVDASVNGNGNGRLMENGERQGQGVGYFEDAH